MEKEKNDVANGQLTIFDIEQDAKTENNNVPKKKYRRCKYCQYWNMLGLNEQPQGEWLDVNEHTAEKRCSNCGRVTQKTEYCHGCGSHNMGIDKTPVV